MDSAFWEDVEDDEYFQGVLNKIEGALIFKDMSVRGSEVKK